MNLLKVILYPFIPVYAFAIWLRNFLFDKNILRCIKVDAKVFSVGNITFGGSGKTPVTIYLTSLLKHAGNKVGVLSRGYGRKSGGYILVSDGKNFLTTVEKAGDEIYHTVLECSVPAAVSENRVKGAEKLIKDTGVNTIVLDDAFQHRWIKRDADILIIDQRFLTEKNFFTHNLLPTGVMRESFSSIKRSDLVIINRKFMQKKDIWNILGFLLFFRFAEAQLVKLVQPFLLDPREVGGLGLSTSEVGIVYGTVGIIALTAGGLIGGYVISRQGLKWWLWPMVIIMHTPDLAFVYLSHVQPTDFILINAAVALEQFGYGFGFTAYMMYMIMISQGEHKTAHYAICTGIMALGMMLPGMFSGALQEAIGYPRFFEWVLISTIPGFIVAALVKIDPEFGKKKKEPKEA